MSLLGYDNKKLSITCILLIKKKDLFNSDALAISINIPLDIIFQKFLIRIDYLSVYHCQYIN